MVANQTSAERCAERIRTLSDALRNDPYGEHDFGISDILRRSFYYKIDYYGMIKSKKFQSIESL